MYLYLVDDASKDRPKKLLHLQRRQQYLRTSSQQHCLESLILPMLRN